MTKEVVNTTMDQVVVDKDCGTKQGISMDVSSKDVVDRYLAAPVKLRGQTLPAGTEMTPEVLRKLRNNRVKKVVVRSPLKCEHGEGLCAKCYGLNENGGLHDKGTNVGVISAQAIGEPGTQMALNTFHHGGIAGKAGKEISLLDRTGQILKMPAKLPGSATLSTAQGRVQRVVKDPAGGQNVFVNGVRHYVPHDRKVRVKPGSQVKKGDPLTAGPINPHELLPLTNMATVQNCLAGELEKTYASKGAKRRNMEVVVRSLTNLSRVVDEGDSDGQFLPGDIARTSKVSTENRKLAKAGKRPVSFKPVLRGIDRVPLLGQEDWLARMNYQGLRDTVIEASAQGWKSDIHGLHPVPGLTYGAEFGKPPVGATPLVPPGAY